LCSTFEQQKRERLLQFEINFIHNIKNNLNKHNIL
jgi:hypothetical protein